MKSAILILSHGRANNCVTVRTLRRQNYRGDWYIVIDDEDEQEVKYRKRYGEHIIRFCKNKAMAHTDSMDNFQRHGAVVYARNECWKIAERLELTHFLVLDDDYSCFGVRYADGTKLKSTRLADVMPLFDATFRFLDESGADAVCWAQGGDFMGGVQGSFYWRGLSRKAMNAWFFRTDRPLEFRGTLNEDATLYAEQGRSGKLFLTITPLAIQQEITQKSGGGLTDIYLDMGTYIKSFYSVIACPSAVTIRMMGGTKDSLRYHHNVDYELCAPKIISERYRK